MSAPAESLAVVGRVVSTPADALQKAADALQSLEREHADSAAALDGRRARHREATSQVEALSQRLKGADPDASTFPRLCGERQTALGRAEALLAQLAAAEAEHKALGGRVQQARNQHERASRAAAAAVIRQSAAELTAAVEKFLRTFGPQYKAHWSLLIDENRARGPASNDPFGIWGTGSPDPGHEAFWQMLFRAHLETLKPGTPEYASAQRAAEIQGQIQASIMNRGSGASSITPSPAPSSSAGVVGHADVRG